MDQWGRDIRKVDRKGGTTKITISWLMEELSGIFFERQRKRRKRRMKKKIKTENEGRQKKKEDG